MSSTATSRHQALNTTLLALTVALGGWTLKETHENAGLLHRVDERTLHLQAQIRRDERAAKTDLAELFTWQRRQDTRIEKLTQEIHRVRN